MNNIQQKTETAIFGGGCFWCTEAAFQKLRGVIAVTPGYAGGTMPNPTYEHVCDGTTGHAEVVKIEFDPNHISYRDLLDVFFTVHDPTTPNRQGADVGTQYRSSILYTTAEQESQARSYIKELTKQQLFADPIVTEIKPLKQFYEAEAYHKNYYQKNPEQAYCQAVINPKLKKLKEKYTQLLK